MSELRATVQTWHLQTAGMRSTLTALSLCKHSPPWLRGTAALLQVLAGAPVTRV